VIWETVVKVADRVGVKATTHALRRAVAVAFLEKHPGALESLRVLMNHSRVDTTQVYLRAMDRSLLMEDVRDLTWGSGFSRIERRPIRDSNPCPQRPRCRSRFVGNSMS
jgi:hypothetical protein